MSNMTKDMCGDKFSRPYGTLPVHFINPGAEVPGEIRSVPNGTVIGAKNV